jgi:hypothetical protein
MRHPERNTKISPATKNISCLLFERGMQRKFLVPLMWNIGYFQRKDGVMSLFHVSKELHLKNVDILVAESECLKPGSERGQTAVA